MSRGPTQPVHVHADLLKRLRDAADIKGVSVAWLVDRLLTEALAVMVPGPIRLTKKEDELDLDRDPGDELERSYNDEPPINDVTASGAGTI